MLYSIPQNISVFLRIHNFALGFLPITLRQNTTPGLHYKKYAMQIIGNTLINTLMLLASCSGIRHPSQSGQNPSRPIFKILAAVSLKCEHKNS